MLIGIPIVLLLAGGGGWWLASIGLRPIREMAGRAAQISLNGMEDLGETRRTTSSVSWPARSTAWWRGCARRCTRSGSSWPMRRTNCARRSRSIRAAADVTLIRERREESEYREALGIVGGQARRAGRLVEDMLVLARADAGGYPLRPVDLYLDEVVTECRRAVDVLATERGVTIQSPASAEIPFRGDEDLLRRLVLNILQNAVQHTPAGGVGGDRHPSGVGGGDDSRDRPGTGHSAGRPAANFRSLRAARCRPRAARARASVCRSPDGSPRRMAERWSSKPAGRAAAPSVPRSAPARNRRRG